MVDAGGGEGGGGEVPHGGIDLLPLYRRSARQVLSAPPPPPPPLLLIYRPAYLERFQIGICKVKNRDLLWKIGTNHSKRKIRQYEN